MGNPQPRQHSDAAAAEPQTPAAESKGRPLVPTGASSRRQAPNSERGPVHPQAPGGAGPGHAQSDAIPLWDGQVTRPVPQPQTETARPNPPRGRRSSLGFMFLNVAGRAARQNVLGQAHVQMPAGLSGPSGDQQL